MRHTYSYMFTADKRSSNSKASIAAVTPFCNSNQVDPTQFILTIRVRCSTKYLGAPSVYSMPMAYMRKCVGYSPQPVCQAHYLAPQISFHCSTVAGERWARGPAS